MRRFVQLVYLALPAGLLVALLVVFQWRGAIAADTVTYLAAGERLNAGHLLYALSPGDRPVFVAPPMWTVPLVYPPAIAVLWRPLAAMPLELGLAAWWLANLAAYVAAVVMLGRRRPLLTATAALLLVVPAGFEVAVGNMHGLFLLGLVVTWRWFVEGRDVHAGVLAGTMAAVKLTPVAVVWWQLVSGRARAVKAAVLASLAVLAVSVVGAGLDAHLEYVRVLRSGDTLGVYLLSLAGIGVKAGLPETIARLLPVLAVAVGLLAMWMLRERPALSFAALVFTMVLGSPAVSINWYVLFLALLAPFAWPIGPREAISRAAGPDEPGEEGPTLPERRGVRPATW